ncbi:MAG: helix-turn-helix domain-containing protein [Chloroflexi bacterium]|nr:helix-turn-helix domain-containing protein [Chloroflexota bacterium]
MFMHGGAVAMMELLTVDEAARLLKVTPTTIRRHINAGRLPAVRVGRSVRIRQEAVEGFLTPVVPAPLDALAAHQESGADQIAKNRATIPPMTDAQVQQALAAVEKMRRVQADQLARRGGAPYAPSWELLEEARDQRTRELS